MSTKPLPSPELLRQLLRYEPDTGKLYWRERSVDLFTATEKRSAEHACAQWNSRFAGKEAFTANNGQGYKQGCILGKTYKAHRIIWAIVYGEWIGEVDHINGIRDDNRIEQLRDGSNGKNRKNLRLPPSNKSGVMGVCWAKESKKWHSYINDNGKRVCLGYFENFDEAVSVRKKAEVRYGYHKNHGNQSAACEPSI
jgi:hypothetical protein